MTSQSTEIDMLLPELLFSRIQNGVITADEARKLWQASNEISGDAAEKAIATRIVHGFFVRFGIQDVTAIPEMIGKVLDDVRTYAAESVQSAVSEAVAKAVAEALEAEERKRAEEASKATAGAGTFDDFMKSLGGQAPSTSVQSPGVSATPALAAVPAARYIPSQRPGPKATQPSEVPTAPQTKTQSRPVAAVPTPTSTAPIPFPVSADLTSQDKAQAPRRPGRPKKVLSFEELDYGEQCRLRGEVIKETDPDLAHLPPRPINPPVSIRDSIQHDHLVCLEDGRTYSMLARSLKSKYGMTPEQYRRRWGLPEDYPMVSPEYSLKKQKNALDQGLGHHHHKK